MRFEVLRPLRIGLTDYKTGDTLEANPTWASRLTMLGMLRRVADEPQTVAKPTKRKGAAK
jgi:hypothetical protein